MSLTHKDSILNSMILNLIKAYRAISSESVRMIREAADELDTQTCRNAAKTRARHGALLIKGSISDRILRCRDVVAEVAPCFCVFVGLCHY